MAKYLIDKIYEMKVNIETCNEMIRDVEDSRDKYITIKFNTWSLRHPLGERHEMELPKSFLTRILELTREEMEERYNNMLSILKGEKD